MDAGADATFARSMISEPLKPEIVPLKWNESPSLSVPAAPEPNTTLAIVDASKSRVPTPSMVAVPFPLTAPKTVRLDPLAHSTPEFAIELATANPPLPDASRTPELDTQFEPVSIVSV